MSEFQYEENEEEKTAEWKHVRDLPRYENDVKEMALQLKMDQNDRFLLASTANGFVVWDFDQEDPISEEAIYLALPHGVRNISTKMTQSNSVMISSKVDYAVAGVR